MTLGSRLRRLLLVCPLVGVVAGMSLASGRTASADTADKTELNERCATRLSIALLGRSPDATLFASATPQASVNGMLLSQDFIERFSRFVNARFNPTPGVTQDEDAAYFMAKRVLAEGKPWQDMFVGPYRVENGAAVDDPNGLGYFRSPAWLKRYAGNEGAGLKIVTGARMLKDTLGLKLEAVTNEPSVDISATGRQAPGCRGCHFENWYALDKVASVLTRRQGKGDKMTFVPSTTGPAALLDGQTIADDKQLVTTIVASEGFRFNVCRLAFQFLYGRAENVCEGPAFDRCMTEFSAKQTMQSAISAVASDPSFCQ